MRVCLPSLLLLAAACAAESPPPDPGDYQVPAAEHATGAVDSDLAGQWLGVLRLTAPGERGPNPSSDSVAMELQLHSDTGFYAADLAPMIGREPPDRGATATRTPTDSILIRLGQGFDRGELELHGRLEGDSLIGRWSQIFYAGGARGQFVLRRVVRAPPG